MNSISSISFLLLACILSGCASKKQDSTSQDSFIQTCERLVNHYPIPRDSLDGAAYGKMFTEDAEFILRGKIIKGRQRIVEDLVTRASKTSTRHVTGSVNVTRLSSTLGTGISYALVFSSDRKIEALPRELDERSLMAVVSYLDKFKFENGECFFSQREVVVDFLNTIKK